MVAEVVVVLHGAEAVVVLSLLLHLLLVQLCQLLFFNSATSKEHTCTPTQRPTSGKALATDVQSTGTWYRLKPVGST